MAKLKSTRSKRQKISGKRRSASIGPYKFGYYYSKSSKQSGLIALVLFALAAIGCLSTYFAHLFR